MVISRERPSLSVSESYPLRGQWRLVMSLVSVDGARSRRNDKSGNQEDESSRSESSRCSEAPRGQIITGGRSEENQECDRKKLPWCHKYKTEQSFINGSLIKVLKWMCVNKREIGGGGEGRGTFSRSDRARRTFCRWYFKNEFKTIKYAPWNLLSWYLKCMSPVQIEFHSCNLLY